MTSHPGGSGGTGDIFSQWSSWAVACCCVWWPVVVFPCPTPLLQLLRLNKIVIHISWISSITHSPPSFSSLPDPPSECLIFHTYLGIDTTVECTAPCGNVLHCTVLFCTVLNCTILYCTVLYCTVLYCNRCSDILKQG